MYLVWYINFYKYLITNLGYYLMLTTVVGSYPVSNPCIPGSISSKVSNFLGFYDPYIPLLECGC